MSSGCQKVSNLFINLVITMLNLLWLGLQFLVWVWFLFWLSGWFRGFCALQGFADMFTNFKNCGSEYCVR